MRRAALLLCAAMFVGGCSSKHGVSRERHARNGRLLVERRGGLYIADADGGPPAAPVRARASARSRT